MSLELLHLAKTTHMLHLGATICTNHIKNAFVLCFINTHAHLGNEEKDTKEPKRRGEQPTVQLCVQNSEIIIQ